MIEHEGTMYAVLKKYGLYNKRDDYIDLCYIGYAKALNTFDESKGSFRNYLYNCCENEILNELRKENTAKRQREECSFDVEYNDEGSTLNDIVPSILDVEQEAISNETSTELTNAINSLTKTEQFIIRNLFDFDICKYNQSELAEILSMDQAQVSRIKDNTLLKLKEMIEI